MSATRTNEWKVGLFVVAALGAAFAALLWLGADKFDRRVIPAVTYLDESVQGLDVGASVKFRGVTIGTVTDIGVAPDRRRVAILVAFHGNKLAALGLRKADAALDPTKPFAPPEVRFQLASSGLVGGKFLALDLFDSARHPAKVPNFPVPWNFIPAEPSTLKSLEDTVTRVLEDAPTFMADSRALLAEARRLIHDLDARNLSKKAQRALDRVEAAVRELDTKALSMRGRNVLDDAGRTARSIDALAVDLNKLVAEVRAEDGDVKRLLHELSQAAKGLREAVDSAQVGETVASVRSTSTAIGGLAEGMGTLQDDVRAALVELREAAGAVRRLADSLDRDPGALIHGKTRPAGPPGGDR